MDVSTGELVTQLSKLRRSAVNVRLMCRSRSVDSDVTEELPSLTNAAKSWISTIEKMKLMPKTAQT